MKDTRRIALLGVLTALVYTGRIFFSFLPNVQPMTTILILITLTLGTREGLIVALLSIFISNMSLGMGVWTIAQLASFSFVILMTAVLKKFYKKLPSVVMASYCGLTGMVYGLVISLVQAPFFGWASFIPYYLSGLPYDMYHAFGNFFFYLILAPILIPILLQKDTQLMRTKN